MAEGLVAAVAHLADAGQPVELSLTGGKDSRLIAAALVKAGVPVVARTHGFADHPDVVVAAEIARLPADMQARFLRISELFLLKKDGCSRKGWSGFPGARHSPDRILVALSLCNRTSRQARKASAVRW